MTDASRVDELEIPFKPPTRRLNAYFHRWLQAQQEQQQQGHTGEHAVEVEDNKNKEHDKVAGTAL